MIVENEAALIGGSLRVYGLIGGVSMLLGVVLLGCSLLPPGGHTSAKINLVAGLILLALGAALWKLSRRSVPAPSLP